ncbi:MAG TPA: peptide MFS transporter [Vitreimonas sp.]|uniref:peptide MFS transporter n=1 Tax=Vitreimonas sp. TaxID=3069702 RepID=UPI002D3941C4|nr:peptide MFS transporter [Vitreimonas sp.]HYD86130.1 peptide MFS transporter [Vitreimonas sp.]
MSVSQSASVPVSSGKGLFGHPPGLTVLFLTQTWAEFSYFGLQAMLVLYMTQQLALPQAQSSVIYGLYTGCAFFSPFIGGIIADRWLGKTTSVVIGGSLMMLGHFAMAFETLLFPALALVAIGNGLFIPPLAVQVGGLYHEGDARRDQAFSAYYMGINLGAFTAIILCPLLAQLYGWHWGFAAAGFGMALGLILYLCFRKHLPSEPSRASVEARQRAPLSKADWKALSTLVGVVAVVILFRIAYEQSGNTITLWLSERTERSLSGFEIPAPWFTSLNPLLIIVLTPFLMAYWRKRKESGREPNLFRRMALGCALAGMACLVMVAAAYAYAASGAPVSALWVIFYFVLLTVGELLVLPVGLALFGTLSPVQVASMMMGAWYIAKFAGSLSAGFIGTLWQVIPTELFFAIGAGATFLAALILFWMGRQRTVVAAS